MALFRLSDRFDPFENLARLQRELDRTVERPGAFSFGLSGRGVFPPVNVFWDKDGSVVRLEVPAVAPEGISIQSEGHTLTISGKRDFDVPAGASFHRRERNAGQFSRSIQLHDDLDLSRAEASYKNGILSIRVPKRAEAKPRQITVKAA